MAQPAANLTLGTAHKKLMNKITEINEFLQRHAMVGSLDTTRQTEAGELLRQLRHRLAYLKILWQAEPNSEELQEWIAGVEDEVTQIFHVWTVFMRARGA
jgi:enoyl-[acyl-carrier-protein] reductase (NADH)